MTINLGCPNLFYHMDASLGCLVTSSKVCNIDQLFNVTEIEMLYFAITSDQIDLGCPNMVWSCIPGMSWASLKMGGIDLQFSNS